MIMVIKNNVEYTVKGVKYSFPTTWSEKILKQKEIAGTIEPYPAHTSGRQVARDEICLKKGRLTVIEEAETKLPNLIPKPLFLDFLEKHIKREIMRLKCPLKGPDLCRLQIYREVFEWIIEAFRTYKPVLSDIKQQYEDTLKFYMDEVARLEPTKKTLWTSLDSWDREVRHHELSENAEIVKLTKRKTLLVNKLQSMTEEQAVLEEELFNLRASLAEHHKCFVENTDARRLLTNEVNSLRFQLDDLSMIQAVCVNAGITNPLNLKLAFEQAKRSHDDVLNKLNALKKHHGNEVPKAKYNAALENYNNLKAVIKDLRGKLDEGTAELEKLNAEYTKVLDDRNFYYLRMQDFKDSNSDKVNSNQILDTIVNLVQGKDVKPSMMMQRLQDELAKRKDTVHAADVKSVIVRASVATSDDAGTIDEEEKISHIQKENANLRHVIGSMPNNSVRHLVELFLGAPSGVLGLQMSSPTFPQRGKSIFHVDLSKFAI